MSLLSRYRSLAGVLLLALLLRVAASSALPPGFTHDESLNAYDAWSLLKTGYDHHGAFLPLFFESNGDWREGLYIWLMAPFLAVFGLEEGAARLPAALIGTANVAALYALAATLFGRRTALMAALFLAVSPWHLHYSRLAWRVITWPFLFCLALWSFLAAVRGNRPGLLSLSAVLSAVGMYTYSAARLFTPPFLLSLTWLYRRPLAAFPRHWLLAASLLFLAFFLPQLMFWLTEQGLGRLAAEDMTERNRHLDPTGLASAWLAYYGLDFLLLSGVAHPMRGLTGYGMLHLFQAALVPLGLVFLFRERDAATRRLLLLWLALYPVAGVLTGVQPHATRSLIGAPLFAIFSALGAARGLAWLRSWRGRASAAIAEAALGVVVAVSLFFYAYAYMTRSVAYWPWWNYSVTRALAWLNAAPYDCIRISDKPIAARYASAHVRFFTKIPPALWLEEGKLGRYVIDALPGGRSASDIRNTTLAARSHAPEAGAIGSGAARNACLLVTFTFEEYEALRGGDYASKLVHTVHNPIGEDVAWMVEVSDGESRKR